MNKEGNQPDNVPYRSLCILNELSANESITQRDLSKKLNIALGLVNSYIKNLVSKGYVTVKAIPARRYSYYLTPKGFAEKTRLTYHLLQDYTRIYRETRESLKKLFREVSNGGMKRVVFAGVDEVAEIAYLTLQETDLELVGVVDNEAAGKNFFGNHIKSVSSITSMNYDLVIVTSYPKRKNIFEELLRNDVSREFIEVIFPL